MDKYRTRDQFAASIVARLLSGESADDAQLDDLPATWRSLIIAMRNRNGVSALECFDNALIQLPPDQQSAVRAAVLTADPHQLLAPPRPRTYSAGELLTAAFPKLRWIADGLIIRPGMTLLGGLPKIGKSWWSLQLARSVSSSVEFLGKSVQERGRVLYYALEDGPSRLQERIKKANWTGAEDVTFIFGDALPPLDKGGLTVLESDIATYKPILVILDSLAAAKTGQLDENDGGQVAELAYSLSRLSTAYDLSLLLIHHHRKLTTGSPLGDLRGSGALGAAADAILALYRERNEPECKLGLDSRDAPGGDWTLGFTGCAWAMLGGATIADEKKAERNAIKALQVLGDNGGTVNDVIDAVAGGMRRQDAIHALQSLVDQDLATLEEERGQDGKAGRSKKVYRLSE